MFAGGGNRHRSSSSKVRTMQLFHELKQQFPTAPDHLVSSCLLAAASKAASPLIPSSNSVPRPMARPQLPPSPVSDDTTVGTETMASCPSPSTVAYTKGEENVQMDRKNDVNKVDNNTFYAKRPNTLGIKSENNFSFNETDRSRRLRTSSKCNDVHKLLTSVEKKPPRSPLTSKKRPVTVSTPSQTTDTLLNTPSPSVNLSLNVNCSMDVVQSPTATKPKVCQLQVTPTQPWLESPTSSASAPSPRSFTSVNLTLRPPSSEPQPPIDITSQNSSLTYSTSSFDSKRGLQSRLQITVGPGGGTVSSVRARPRSFHLDEGVKLKDIDEEKRAGSLDCLLTSDGPSGVVQQQQARFDRLKIELMTDKTKLVVMQRDYAEMLRKKREKDRLNNEVKRQLEREIKHLKVQCLNLTDQDSIYTNIYTGQRPSTAATIQQPLHVPHLRPDSSPTTMQQQPFQPLQPPPGWNCSLCTFLNHPDLSKCEQCEMPRTTYHVSAAPGDNIQIHVTQRLPRSKRVFEHDFAFLYAPLIVFVFSTKNCMSLKHLSSRTYIIIPN
ncbi:TGF-beta-activated kinase 1 and MAP3K7-binding protein 2 isoform X2 [Aethina tumida]|uniref:TGF-beta-activated kinase 1 and MAP3K7-binding protein 2 isoform X2 n=1 Tax=Aethina tumida TaxID=116153 RepID=UPI002147E7AB|nr:TGF-beta-activated kinase 1 and MAP3K7-binding protein 2 isoform X2 [Aethina tumida]